MLGLQDQAARVNQLVAAGKCQAAANAAGSMLVGRAGSWTTAGAAAQSAWKNFRQHCVIAGAGERRS